MSAISAVLPAATPGLAAAVIGVFFAGVVSSFGPCTVTRLVAVAGISAGSAPHLRARAGVAFTGGLVTTYAGFGAVAGLLSGVVRFTHVMYAAVAVGCFIAGAAALLGKGNGKHCCAPSQRKPAGGAFLLGAGFAFVISPCCTPLLTALLAYGGQSGNAREACILFGAFGLGHAVPVLAAAFAAEWVRDGAAKLAGSDAVRAVTGGLLLSMAGYYGCLA